MPRYRVTHATSYSHGASATASWQSLHLQPRTDAAQVCESFDLDITPRPGDLAARVDFFGNRQHFFALREFHSDLSIVSRSVVDRHEPAIPMAGLTPAIGEMRSLIAKAVATDDFTLAQFLHASPLVPLLPAAKSLAREAGGELTPVLTWLTTLGAQFKAAFAFDPAATNVTTPLAEVLALRRGVCQDFAHLLVCCLRQHGLPAAYVSGYLLTDPPPGQPRLRGADASHAWVSVFIPGTGWVDYDPTNACFAAAGHIVVARGRDYADVSPVRGVFNGGIHSLSTEVTVEPVEAA